MSEYIVDDRSLDMIEKIRNMTDEEFEEYLATLREKKKLKTEHGKENLI